MYHRVGKAGLITKFQDQNLLGKLLADPDLLEKFLKFLDEPDRLEKLLNDPNLQGPIEEIQADEINIERAFLNQESKLIYTECIGYSDDFVYCSNNKCPCDQTKLYRNSGYIYIDKEFIEIRSDCLTWKEFENKLERIRLERDLAMLVDTGIGVPIMMCEQGARLRRLNIDVAASDAKHWWTTGLVPLRVTPLRE